jgi:hypothetical protein
MITNFEEATLIYAGAGLDLEEEYRSMAYTLTEANNGQRRLATAKDIAEQSPPIKKAILYKQLQEADWFSKKISASSPLGSLILEERARYNFWMGGKQIYEITRTLCAELLTISDLPGTVLPAFPTGSCFLYYPDCSVTVGVSSGKQVPINGCYVFPSRDAIGDSWETEPTGNFLAFEWLSAPYEVKKTKQTNWRISAHVSWDIWANTRLSHITEIDNMFEERNSPGWLDTIALQRLAVSTLLYLSCTNADRQVLSSKKPVVKKKSQSNQPQEHSSRHTKLPCIRLGRNEKAPTHLVEVKQGCVFYEDLRTAVPAAFIPEAGSLQWIRPQVF